MVTSLEYIKATAEGKEVEIVGWEEETPFVCKLKRVSMLHLVKSGKVPNGLLSAVMALFDGNKEKVEKINAKEMTDIIDLFCSCTLVEPTFNEIDEYLTDEQRTEIFNYAQGGLKQLENFRKK